jgi:hypothetical protein
MTVLRGRPMAPKRSSLRGADPYAHHSARDAAPNVGEARERS